MEQVPERQIRAAYDESTIRVYQAYSNAIADSALAAGRFVSPPFKMQRMTWIKPSFYWMMYRCDWATKPGQERVLAINIVREGFEWALAHSCLSHFEPNAHGSMEAWQQLKEESSVRIQWDPERDIRMKKLDYRSIQIGLSGEAVERYASEWISHIEDITQKVLESGSACRTMSEERPYRLPLALAARIGATAEINPERV